MDVAKTCRTKKRQKTKTPNEKRVKEETHEECRRSVCVCMYEERERE